MNTSSHDGEHPAVTPPLSSRGSSRFDESRNTITRARSRPWSINSTPTIALSRSPTSDEDPLNHDGNWADAGIVIRGATVDTSTPGKTLLHLAPTTTLADMNLVDVGAQGQWQQEIYGVGDNLLPPNLVEPVQGMKRLILQMAGLP